MRNLAISLQVAIFIIISNSTELRASSLANDSTQLVSMSPSIILARLEEIKAMDISTFSRTEKQALRQELRALKKSSSTSNTGGGLISIGGLIIFALLVVILL